MTTTDQSKLLIVWTSGDRDVALKMVFMYAGNAMRYGWWEEVNLLVWGPSQKLLVQDEQLQEELAVLIELGVTVGACKACADSYPVTEQLEGLGVEVFYSGEFLTNWIRSGVPLVTF
ncbi:MAG: DsrE family protein [Anaerolineae bacterium]|jgi:hypothetical protein